AIHRLENFGGASRLAGDMLAADEMPVLDHVPLPGACVIGALMPQAFARSNANGLPAAEPLARTWVIA
ncbi:hypothetical protein, partial [Roseiarcus sp.]|uniref:hypothetical protein n=1 Tax=Roseiarcus sp. TaxID=1969460 RepID=UPI003C57472A